MTKTTIQEYFDTAFSSWLMTVNPQPGVVWVSLSDLHSSFIASGEHPHSITKCRLGRALTQRFPKRLGGKPLQIGYLLKENLPTPVKP